MSALFPTILVLNLATRFVTSQRTFTCPNNGLQSPPAVMHGATRPEDIEWEVDPNDPNIFKYELVFDGYVKEWETLNARIRTRLFNDYFPLQTLRFERGKQYQINVINNLGPESPDNPPNMNVEKDPNTTNVECWYIS